MKHLKGFNEELNTSTYQSASNLLNAEWRKSGNEEFKKRAKDLKRYALLKKTSKFGKTPITIQYNFGLDIITGNFYLDFYFDNDNYEDIADEYLQEDKINITFSVGLIPADSETTEKLKKVSDYDDYHNGFWVILDFEDKGDLKGLQLSKLTTYSYDYDEFGKISFTRPLAGAIRRHLVACFGNSEYEQDGRPMSKVLEEEVLIKSGASSHFGVGMDDLYDFVKDITPNEIMSSVEDKPWKKR